MRKQDLIEFISESNGPVTKREIARAFSIKGQDKPKLTSALKDLEKEQLISKQSGAYIINKQLPEVVIINITGVNADGEYKVRPKDWDVSIKGPYPNIELKANRKRRQTFSTGDEVLVKLKKQKNGSYQAEPIQKLKNNYQKKILGIAVKSNKGFVLSPTDKKNHNEYEIILDNNSKGLKEGDLVEADLTKNGGRSFKKKAKVSKIIGPQSTNSSYSTIAIHENNLRDTFSEAVLNETKGMKVPKLGDREDLRSIPLVTIDGADARDFDDAVFAEKTDDGTHIIVAIADVAYYVRPGSELDKEAYQRGNSTYFPDKVVPMLPEALSNGLCSLRPDEERACIAMHLWINDEGELTNYLPTRALMKSKARLTYEQVQEAKDGNPDQAVKPLMNDVINPLFEAYEILAKARKKRGALNIRSQEKQIVLDDNGQVEDIKQRIQLDAHKLIEEFMILANVAALSALENKNGSCVYRVHEKPDAEKINNVSEFLSAFGIKLPKGQAPSPKQLNKILQQADQLPEGNLIHEAILRSMSQAHYTTENKSHYGLALDIYGHFTSPIRRYPDLLVHRSLIKSFNLGPGALSKRENATLQEKAEHTSSTERVSMVAERSTVDRYVSQYLEENVGQTFTGRITGFSKAGLFIALDKTGADGFLPRRFLPKDYYIADEKKHALIGKRTGRIYRRGADIEIRIKESDGLKGSTIFEPVNSKGADIKGLNFKPN
jgi:ribonuclease R